MSKAVVQITMVPEGQTSKPPAMTPQDIIDHLKHLHPDDLADLAKGLQAEVKPVYVRLTTIAEELHTILCQYNHTDGCDWHYGSWEKPRYARGEYLLLANALVNQSGLGAQTVLKVLVALETAKVAQNSRSMSDVHYRDTPTSGLLCGMRPGRLALVGTRLTSDVTCQMCKLILVQEGE